uniref:Snake toxin/toxin-like domain-containing protein n=1 Tax=Falco tinnunculus TaxID=100819 RepID=A0A8C4TYQ7_FALTI
CLPFLPVLFFFPPLAYPFMCYVCQEQESNKNCLSISMCAKEDKYCVTVRLFLKMFGQNCAMADSYCHAQSFRFVFGTLYP